jgi:endogenous inhibitor of DNA gyrase (YacG/DUF329 family)
MLASGRTYRPSGAGGGRIRGDTVMTSVRCPICEQRIVGEYREQLDRRLREHFSVRHGFDLRPESGPYPTRVVRTEMEERGPEHRPPHGRLYQASLRREEQTWAPDESSLPPRPEGLGDWFRKSIGIDRMPEERNWARGEGYPSFIGGEWAWEERGRERPLVRERYVASTECPICGRTIEAADEQDLSWTLHEHMRTVHKTAPMVTEARGR